MGALPMLAELRAEVKRLSLICGKDLYSVLAPGLSTMDAEGLLGLKAAFEQRVAEKLLPQTQLPGANEIVRFDGAAYQI